jgi:NAD(P)-dependent dehydrogenase (short-subunit alcohol dehydrogenase family)
MKYELTARIAPVTGGSRGLGRAAAVPLAQAGADVIVMLAGNGYPTGHTIGVNAGWFMT